VPSTHDLSTIRVAVEGGTNGFEREGDGYHVPMPALVGSGAKP